MLSLFQKTVTDVSVYDGTLITCKQKDPFSSADMQNIGRHLSCHGKGMGGGEQTHFPGQRIMHTYQFTGRIRYNLQNVCVIQTAYHHTAVFFLHKFLQNSSTILCTVLFPRQDPHITFDFIIRQSGMRCFYSLCNLLVKRDKTTVNQNTDPYSIHG